jgi:hypothetical protein
MSKKADYVIALKGNQKNLHKAVQEHFLYNPISDRSAKVNVYEYGHWRVEQREYWLEPSLTGCLNGVTGQDWQVLAW